MILVSAIQPSESALHISPLLWNSFQVRSPQSSELSSLGHTVGSHWLSILHIVSIKKTHIERSLCFFARNTILLEHIPELASLSEKYLSESLSLSGL